MHIQTAGRFPAIPHLYSVNLVRESEATYEPIELATPEKIARLMIPFVTTAVVEHFIILLLNTKNRLIGSVEISRGDLSSAIVHPREVFTPAILGRSAAIVAIHNHPSGDPTPSQRDVDVTRRLRQAGELLGISLLDHIIVTENPLRFYSFQQHGFLGTSWLSQ